MGVELVGVVAFVAMMICFFFVIAVEICITLGRMTGSPFSPVHPVPAK
jgi:hypothetical protein